MSADADEHVVLEFERRGQTVVRLIRRRRDGATDSELRRYYREKNGTVRPTKQGVSIRDSELPALINALEKIAAKVGAQPSAQLPPRAPAHQQRELPGTRRQPQDDGVGAATDAELAEIRRAF